VILSEDQVKQYGSDANLNARIDLHRRFSTSPISWNRWLFEQMPMPKSTRVLELGAGTGLLWIENRDRLPDGLQLILSDNSQGMLSAAKAQVAGLAGVEFRQIDAGHLPDVEQSFDVVIANHMLYHVSDRAAVFSQVVRVLRPNGRFYAATNGNAHMRELDDLIGPKAGAVQLSATLFGLENGCEQLAPFFGSIEMARHQNPLAVTDVSAVSAYVRSMMLELPGKEMARIEHSVRTIIATDGAFRISRDSGIFICAKPRRAAS